MSSILDHPLLSERYFFPQGGALRDPFFVDCGEARLACCHRAPHPDGKTVVHFHGNGEVVADCVHLLAAPLARLGLNAFFAEYRGYGMSGGTPALVAMLADVPRMIRALGLPQEQLILFGRSVGSIYALHATSHFPNVAGLVIESGVADPLERILLRVEPDELGVTEEELESEVRSRLDHRRLLKEFTVVRRVDLLGCPHADTGAFADGHSRLVFL